MFRDMSIKKKLTVILMTTGTVAVLLACIVFYVMTTDQVRKSYESDLVGLAQILGKNCEAALAFQIPEEAVRVLTSLSVRPSVTYAVILNTNGDKFASYGTAPGGFGENGRRPDDRLRSPLPGYLQITQEIEREGIAIGSLILVDDMRGMKRARLIAVWMMLIAVLISTGIVFVMISFLQRLISRPVLSLSSAAERISKERDFSLRVEKHGNDEVGQLVDNFNAMIGQIEKRNLELLSSEKRFRTLVDQAVDAFFLFDPEGRIVDVNQRACDSLGYTRDELLSLSVKDIDAGEAAVRSDEKAWENLQPHVPVTNETVHRRKDGSTLTVEVRLGIMEISGRLFIMGLARDISERRRSEEEKKKLEFQLQQAQKMEAIGHLAGGIAHDFNNMLTAIIGYGNLLNMKIGEKSPLKNYVEQILNSSEKSADLTRQLLAFSRNQIISPKQRDLNQLITGMEKLLNRIIGEDIELMTRLTDKALPVMVDTGQIEQVLMNLCTNARDAMPNGGCLSVVTKTVHLDEDYIAASGIEKAGIYALMSVSDSGKGMDETTRLRIFEPFFTTKEVGKGTGLGLAIVYGIIKQHGGHITVYSEPGKGTTFKIYLPLVEPVEEAEATAEMIVPKGGTETILVAEDNEDVRKLERKVLEGVGYTVIEAVDGEDAINKFEENKERIQLALLDVIMPKKSGKEVYDRIKKVKPGMKILFTSGYTSDVISTKGILEEKMSFISKPVSPNDLLVKIREILDT
ncbi:MAG: PAS domain S-box protein [Nitrospirota bacterium]|nr:PAS domain S-box protein [Nitrospirota bacterium]